MAAARTALIVDLDRPFAAKLETKLRALNTHTEVLHNGDEACERAAGSRWW